jgi:hypothetical protein
MASGVPTVSQWPRIGEPNRRPFACSRIEAAVEGKASLGDVLENARMKDDGAGIDHRFTGPLVAGQPAIFGHDEVAGAGVAGGLVEPGGHQQDIHRFGIETIHHPAEVVRRAARFLQPERVGVEDQKRLGSEHGQGPDDAAARIEKLFGFIGYADVGTGPRREPIDQQRREIMHVDDDIGDTGPAKRFQPVGDQRFSRHFDQGLGQGLGDRTHAGAKPGGQDHGRCDGHRSGGSGL